MKFTEHVAGEMSYGLFKAFYCLLIICKHYNVHKLGTGVLYINLTRPSDFDLAAIFVDIHQQFNDFPFLELLYKIGPANKWSLKRELQSCYKSLAHIHISDSSMVCMLL